MQLLKQTDQLSAPERESLQQYEAVIGHSMKVGQEVWIEAARAMQAINTGRLYRAEYSTFEDYAKARWNFSRESIYRYLHAVAASDNVLTSTHSEQQEKISSKPMPSLSQAFELAVLPPEQQRELAAETDFTKTSVRQLREKVRAIQPPKKSTPRGPISVKKFAGDRNYFKRRERIEEELRAACAPICERWNVVLGDIYFREGPSRATQANVEKERLIASLSGKENIDPAQLHEVIRLELYRRPLVAVDPTRKAARLAKLKAVIRAIKETDQANWFESGWALQEIRRCQLVEGVRYEDYVRDELGIAPRNARYRVDAALVIENVGIEMTFGKAQELCGVDQETQRKIVKRKNFKDLSSKDIRELAAKLPKRNPPKKYAKDPLPTGTVGEIEEIKTIFNALEDLATGPIAEVSDGFAALLEEMT